jgi:replication initiation protein RepC
MHISTTPVGRRPMTRAILSGLQKAIPTKKGRAIDKWTAFDTIKNCHRELDLSSRSISVLYAMISFLPGKEISDVDSLIIWPSNKSLCDRCHGISEATLRRSISELITAGIVVRRDSPNGKRYARRGQGGEIKRAFGFDLTPVITRNEEFQRVSRAVREQQQELATKKEELSVLRREIVKMLDFCQAEGIHPIVEELKNLYLARTRDLPRKMNQSTVEAAIASLRPILEEINNSLNSLPKPTTMSANDLQNERHIESSNPESKKTEDSNIFLKEKMRGGPSEANTLYEPATLEYLNRRCHQIKLISGITVIRSWNELFDIASKASRAIGVQAQLWSSLISKFTPSGAATLISLLYEQLDTISAPFAYLSKLTQDVRPADEIVRSFMIKNSDSSYRKGAQNAFPN